MTPQLYTDNMHPIDTFRTYGTEGTQRHDTPSPFYTGIEHSTLQIFFAIARNRTNSRKLEMSTQFAIIAGLTVTRCKKLYRYKNFIRY